MHNLTYTDIIPDRFLGGCYIEKKSLFPHNSYLSTKLLFCKNKEMNV